jgi:hypothetical protein
MNYHILKIKKGIIFWNPKSGVTSILEMIMHLTDGRDHSNPNADEKTHKTYWNNFRVTDDVSADSIGEYKKIFFARNTYHRVASCFLDKYVDGNSPSTEDIPDCDNFYEFVKILKSTDLKRDKMKGVVDFEHFSKLTDWRGWEFYCELGRPKFDLVITTPTTALPEGKIVHNYENIKSVYDLLGCSKEYESIKHLYEKDYYSYDVWKVFKPKIDFAKKNFAKTSIGELKGYHGFIGRDRTIPYANFYTPELIDIISELYTEELDFYRNEIGIEFEI